MYVCTVDYVRLGKKNEKVQTFWCCANWSQYSILGVSYLLPHL